MIQTICKSQNQIKNVNYRINKKKKLKGPFSHNAGCIFDRINPYNDTNNLCMFKKNWIKKCRLYPVNEKKISKILKGPFSHNV